MKFITRNKEGIRVEDDVSLTVPMGLLEYINRLCIKNLSTYQGRVDAARKLLGQKRCVPVFINQNIILVPSKSMRDQEMIFLNACRILGCSTQANKTVVLFDDSTVLIVDISKRLLQKRIKMANGLIEACRSFR